MLLLLVAALFIAVGAWLVYFSIRSSEWTKYAKLRLTDNFWKVLDDGGNFSDPVLDQFARDLTKVSRKVLSGRLQPVAYPSSDFVQEAREELSEKLDKLTTKRHFDDSRQVKEYAEETEHLNAYIGMRVFGAINPFFGNELNHDFVEQFIKFKASGLDAVIKPIPISPNFPLGKIPGVFWNDSLRRHEELAGR